MSESAQDMEPHGAAVAARRPTSAQIMRFAQTTGIVNLEATFADALKDIDRSFGPEALGWNVLFGDNYVLVYP